MYCDGCSTKAAYNRRWRAGVTNPIEPRPYVRLLPREAVCERCGDTYMQTTATQLYCGQPCGEFVTATCAGCGTAAHPRLVLRRPAARPLFVLAASGSGHSTLRARTA